MKIWILTKEYNQYNQFGAYYVEAFVNKPTFDQIFDRLKKFYGYAPTEDECYHILSGGGRISDEYMWFTLHHEEIQ